MGEVVEGKFKKSPKRSRTELLESIATAINREAQTFNRPWPWPYHVIQPAPGVSLILEESPGQVLTEVPIRRLADRIVCWMRLHGVPEWFVTVRQALEAADMWLSMASQMPLERDEIKPVRWADEPGWTWRRLPWAFDPTPGPCPLFEEFFSRCSDPELMWSFAGSILECASNRQQYLWNHGTGRNGKSSYAAFWGDILADGAVFKAVSNSNHWAENLPHKRLIVFPDCNSRTFVSSGIFKQLLGDDSFEINPKGAKVYHTKITGKIIIISNNEPTISSETADTRRIMLVHTKPFKDEEDDGYRQRMWDEGQAFLSRALIYYRTHYPKHGPLKLSEETLGLTQSLVSFNEEEFQDVFDQNFIATPSGFVQGTEMQRMLRISTSIKDPRAFRREFCEWLSRTYGIRYGIKRFPGDRRDTRRGYIGLQGIPAA